MIGEPQYCLNLYVAIITLKTPRYGGDWGLSYFFDFLTSFLCITLKTLRFILEAFVVTSSMMPSNRIIENKRGKKSQG